MNLCEVYIEKVNENEIKCKNIKNKTIVIKKKKIINFNKFKKKGEDEEEFEKELVKGIQVRLYEEYNKFYIYDLVKPEPNQDIYPEFIKSIIEKEDFHSTMTAQFQSFLETMKVEENDLIKIYKKYKEYNSYIDLVFKYYEKFNKLYIKCFDNFELNIRNIKEYPIEYYSIISDLLNKVRLKNFLDFYKTKILDISQEKYVTEEERYKNYCNNKYNKFKKKKKTFNEELYSKNPICISNKPFFDYLLEYFDNYNEETHDIIKNRSDLSKLNDKGDGLNLSGNKPEIFLSLEKFNEMILNKNNSNDLYKFFKNDLSNCFKIYDDENDALKTSKYKKFTKCIEDFINKYIILYRKDNFNINEIFTSYEYIDEIIQIMNKYNSQKVLDFIETNISQETQVIYNVAYSINYDLKEKCWLLKKNYNYRSKILKFFETINYIKIIEGHFTLNSYFESEYNIINFLKDFIIKEKKIKLSNVIKNDINKLNSKQKKFFDNFNKNDIRIGILEGNAGTGKTYTASLILKNLNHNKIPFIVLSLTGKAVKNISTNFEKIIENEKIIKNDYNDKDNEEKENKPDYEFCTIDKFLHSIKRCDHYKVLIIEEVGMISTEKLSDFFNKLRNCKSIIKLLFLGNNKQLAPIDKGEPYDFLQKWAIKEDRMIFEELTDIMRQKDTEIPEAAKLICEGKSDELIHFISKYSTINLIDISDKKNENKKEKEIKKNFKTIKSPDNTLILNYRKKHCFEDNYIVQKILSKKKKDMDYKGCFLINNKIIFKKNIYNNDNEPIIMNGETGIITDMSISENIINIKLDISDNKFNLMKLNLTENLANDLEEYYKFVIKNKFYFVKKNQCEYDFDLGWAITVHKAQGSESDHVILYVDNGCERRLLNTALTRAKKSITIYSTLDTLKKIINKPIIKDIDKFDYILENFESISHKKKTININVNVNDIVDLYRYINLHGHQITKQKMYFKNIFNYEEEKKIIKKWKANNNNGTLSIPSGTLIINLMKDYLEN